MEVKIMKMMKSIIPCSLMALGMVYLYKELKNGNLAKMVSKCKDAELNMIDEMDDML